ncbi:MAG: hypothetical protein ACK4NQ_04280 [Fimbriimonadaceae bacterium]
MGQRQEVNGREALTLTARVLAKKSGVEVVFDQKLPTGATDGARVVINAGLARAAAAYPWAADVVRGLLDHEVVGHALHTDFKTWKMVMKKISPGSLHGGVIAVLEDLRIETAASGVYPGVAGNLGRCVRAMCDNTKIFGVEDADEIWSSAQARPAVAIVNFLLSAGRCLISSMQREALQKRADAWGRVVARLFGQDIPGRLIEVAGRARHAASTMEVVRCADEIMKMIKDRAEESGSGESGSGESGSGESGSGESGSGESGSGESGSGESGSGESGSGESGSGESGSGESGSGESGSGESGSGESGSGESGSGDAGKSYSAAASAALSDNRIAGVDLASAIEDELKEVMTASVELGVAKIVAPNLSYERPLGDPAIVHEVRNTLARNLDLLLEAKVMRRREVGLSGRKIDGGALYRVSTRDGRIFRRTHEEEGINTAVSILLDGSSSMCAIMAGNRFRRMARSAISRATVEALCGLLHAADVPFEVGVFGTALCVVKPFDVGWSSRKSAFANTWGSSTVLYPSMVEALTNIAVRDEERKLLVLVTDGDVSAAEAAATCSLVAAARSRFGVEVSTLFLGETSRLAGALAGAGFDALSTNSADEVASYLVRSIEKAIA